MQLIPCPHCGFRDETEFRWGGEAHVTRPGIDATDAVWTAYLFQHRNPKGPSRERWLHAAGCGQWFNLLRDTATHRILQAYRMGETPR